MKNWNKTGFVKAILLLLLSLPNMIAPYEYPSQFGVMTSLLMPLLFGLIATYFFLKNKLGSKIKEIKPPHWNDNPLKNKSVLSISHFGGYFFSAIGLAMLLGSFIKFKNINEFGLMSLAFGLGIILSIKLTFKVASKTK
tara:strand:- start:37 stop:453 length:417 start_codon:yes stop_codon:yes gene_type:complete